MAAIGNSPTQQAFTPAIDYFSGNGSTTAFTLSRPVASVAQVQVTIDNVAQNPSSAFTVSANTITFTSAPLSGTNNIYVYYTSPITQVIAPSQGTVQTAQLGNITNIASGNSSLTLQTGSSPTTAVTIDTSQRVGVSVVPSAWSLLTPMQVKNGYIAGYLNRVYVGANNYYDGSNSRYIATDFATRYYQLNGTHGWETAASGTAGAAITFTSSMTLDSNNVLNLPNAPSGDAHVKIQQGAVTTLGAIASSGIQISGGGSNNQLCQISLGYPGTYAPTAISSITTTQSGYTIADLIFATRSVNTDTAPSERFRIDSTGRTFIATTSNFGNGGWLNVDASANSNTANGINVKNHSSSYSYIAYTNTNFMYFTTTGGSPVGTITYNGSNTVYGTTSDRRLKENIVDAPSAFDFINSLKIRSFDWKESGKHHKFGVIAQELVEVSPESVSVPQKEEDIWQVDTSALVPSLVKAIQELKAINDTQAETINALTARIVALENR